MTTKPKKRITLITGHLSGSNTAVLYKLLPQYIEDKYEVSLEVMKNLDNYSQEVKNSDVFITTHGHYPYFKDKINIELWHGFPLKGMANMDVEEKATPEDISNYWRHVDLIMSYSNLYNTLLNACMGANIKQYRITGMPRNDMLLSPTSRQKLSKLMKLNLQEKRVMFYMPTFRQSADPNDIDGTKSWDNVFGLDYFNDTEFNQFLKDNQIVLVIKLHPYEESIIKNQVNVLGHGDVHLLTNDMLNGSQTDLYEILGGSDALITDYSSVYFDYLLLNKPIIFTPIDLEQYRAKRGFLLEPYDFWTPGPKVFDQQSLQKAILESLSDSDYYRKERAQITDMVHTYKDTRSSERVWKTIDEYIENYDIVNHTPDPNSTSEQVNGEKLVSLCMIVKDEESVLERCLKSVEGLVDEIIIIDTGSTDGTKDIAKRFTDHIYDYEWTHDFSAAKNEAIKRATGKWILVLDADEYLEQKDASELREFLSQQTPAPNKVFLMPIINFMGKSMKSGNIMESSADRIFPNFMGIQYTRPIHEQLTSTRGVIIGNTRVSCKIYHTGYLESTLSTKDKSNRNKKIFEQFKKNNQFGAYDYFTLANEYVITGDIKQAYSYYKRAMKGAYKGTAWYPHCLMGLINTTLQLGYTKEGWDLIEKKLSDFRDYPEYPSIKALIYEHFGLVQQAELAYKEAIELADKRATSDQSFWLISPDFGCKTPYSKLANIYYRIGDISNSIYCLTKLLMNDSSNLNALIKLAELLVQQEQTSAITALFDKLYPEPTSLQIAMLFHTALAIGHLELVQYYHLQCKEHQIPISNSDTLRLSLLMNDKTQFKETVEKLTDTELHEDKVVINLALASLIWQDTQYTSAIEVHSLINALITQEPLLPSDVESHRDDIMAYLTGLFTLKHFETYDRLVNQLNDPTIIRNLANYFYNKNQLDVAVNYFTVLLKDHEDTLDAKSYENIAQLHFNQHLTEDGLYFLQKAIDEAPERKELYVSYCIHCNDPLEKENRKKQLIQKFPQYRKLPFIQKI